MFHSTPQHFFPNASGSPVAWMKSRQLHPSNGSSLWRWAPSSSSLPWCPGVSQQPTLEGNPPSNSHGASKQSNHLTEKDGWFSWGPRGLKSYKGNQRLILWRFGNRWEESWWRRGGFRRESLDYIHWKWEDLSLFQGPYWLVVSNIFYVPTLLGEMIQFDHIFQLGGSTTN